MSICLYIVGFVASTITYGELAILSTVVLPIVDIPVMLVLYATTRPMYASHIFMGAAVSEGSSGYGTHKTNVMGIRCVRRGGLRASYTLRTLLALLLPSLFPFPNSSESKDNGLRLEAWVSRVRNVHLY